MFRCRMHYGHPDVFDRVFHITRGGISKASRVINISEDIYAGMSVNLIWDVYYVFGSFVCQFVEHNFLYWPFHTTCSIFIRKLLTRMERCINEISLFFDTLNTFCWFSLPPKWIEHDSITCPLYKSFHDLIISYHEYLANLLSFACLVCLQSLLH